MAKYDGEERRKNISMNGLPEWVKIANILGFPALIVLIFLAMFTGYIPSPVTETRDMIKIHIGNEAERTRIIRVMCRHQSAAFKQNADDCDWSPK